MIIQGANAIVNLGNVDEMTGSLFLLLTNVTHSFKYFVCIYRSSDMDELINYARKRKMEGHTDSDIKIIKR